MTNEIIDLTAAINSRATVAEEALPSAGEMIGQTADASTGLRNIVSV